MAKYLNKITMLSAVTATTTSAPALVADREHMSAQLISQNISSGNGVFFFEISNDDGTTWSQYNRLVTNVTNTNVQEDTRVANTTFSANTSSFVFFPEQDFFELIRARVTVTTDGSYSVILYTRS